MTQKLYWKGAGLERHRRPAASARLARLQRHHGSGSLRHLPRPADAGAGDALQLKVPLPGLLPGIPQIPLTASNLSALQADLTTDLAVPDWEDAGTYYGPKAWGGWRPCCRSPAGSAIPARHRRSWPSCGPGSSTGSPTPGRATSTGSPTTRSGAGSSAIPANSATLTSTTTTTSSSATWSPLPPRSPRRIPHLRRLRLGRRPARRRHHRGRDRHRRRRILPAVPGVLGLRGPFDRVRIHRFRR